MSAALVLPTKDLFEVRMVKVCETIKAKVELLDIYHYLGKRQDDLPFKLSKSNFGHLIGFHIPRTTLSSWLSREKEYRRECNKYPEGAQYIIDRKNCKVEQVLYHWLEDQRKQNIPVNGKMIKEAAKVTYTVLADIQDDSDLTAMDAAPSFSASWFDAFKERYRVSYCQLRGEAGSVDLEAIEPELAVIRNLCAQYTADNIFNCDETGMYLKELDTKSYTTLQSTSGAKAIRDCRVSILFCINASGSSLSKANSMDSLRPLVIGNRWIYRCYFSTTVIVFASFAYYHASLISNSQTLCKEG